MEISKGNTFVIVEDSPSKPIWSKVGPPIWILDVAWFKSHFPTARIMGRSEDTLQIDAIPPAALMYQEIVLCHHGRSLIHAEC
jgi:hypothetical protein